MHVVCVSYFYERRLQTAEELLEAYPTLTGWAEGLLAAGAEVSVVQRFRTDEVCQRRGVSYRFVADPALRPGGILDLASRVNRAIVRLHPDVVHANGLYFARQAWLLKRLLPKTPVLIQDHANYPPSRRLRAIGLRFALQGLDGISFTARAQADPWRKAGYLPADMPVFELMEGSSRFRLKRRADAGAYTGLQGDPLCLWVGRLNANKDPLTVLEGFALALPRLPNARLAMAYGEDALLPAVSKWLDARPQVAERVKLLGKVPHADLEEVFNSADFFVSGSHQEGSGYAALEALACGLTPILTDIPSFRALCGSEGIGTLWPVGDVGALAAALVSEYARLTPETPNRVRAHFDAHLTFEAIGRKAMDVYARLGAKN